MSILIQVFNNHSSVKNAPLEQWQLLLKEARASKTMAQLYAYLSHNNVDIPEQVRWHLSSAQKVADKQKRQTLRELLAIKRCLSEVSVDSVVLKGAAYICQGLTCSRGRVFSDIDLLVTQAELPMSEIRLSFHGYLKSKIEDYNEEYYRKWMHEIPPLRHESRGTVIDLHHNILPRTNKQHFDASQFEFIEVDVEEIGSIRTLSRRDMLLHCAVHLFTESEFDHGIRDLLDLHLMLQEFQLNKDNFLDDLTQRAIDLGIANYLYFAIRYSRLIFATPISESTIIRLDTYRPSCLAVWDFAFLNVFKPNIKSNQTWKTPIAKFLTYWRGHLLRMPIKILLPHLLRKSWMQLRDKFSKEDCNNHPIP